MSRHGEFLPSSYRHRPREPFEMETNVQNFDHLLGDDKANEVEIEIGKVDQIIIKKEPEDPNDLVDKPPKRPKLSTEEYLARNATLIRKQSRATIDSSSPVSPAPIWVAQPSTRQVAVSHVASRDPRLLKKSLDSNPSPTPGLHSNIPFGQPFAGSYDQNRLPLMAANQNGLFGSQAASMNDDSALIGQRHRNIPQDSHGGRQKSTEISFKSGMRSVGCQVDGLSKQTVEQESQTTRNTEGFDYFIADVRALSQDQRDALSVFKTVGWRSFWKDRSRLFENFRQWTSATISPLEACWNDFNTVGLDKTLSVVKVKRRMEAVILTPQRCKLSQIHHLRHLPSPQDLHDQNTRTRFPSNFTVIASSS